MRTHLAPSEEKAGAMAVWASFDREPATAALWVSMVNFSDPRSSGSTLGLLTTTYLAPTTSYLQQHVQRHMDSRRTICFGVGIIMMWLQ